MEPRTSQLVFSKLSSLLSGGSEAEANLRQYWMPDDISLECYECTSKFTSFRRRHHCRVCGQVFCSRCCSSYIPGKQLSEHYSDSQSYLCREADRSQWQHQSLHLLFWFLPGGAGTESDRRTQQDFQHGSRQRGVSRAWPRPRLRHLQEAAEYRPGGSDEPPALSGHPASRLASFQVILRLIFSSSSDGCVQIQQEGEQFCRPSLRWGGGA